jgi:glyoxylase-like metal-dependent hydrolase (beta-lactamase superfamily II)
MKNGEKYSVSEYPGGVLAVDSGYVRERMAACYILEAEGEAAVIETGTNASTPRLLQTLELRGWSANDVRYVIVTHVHLDHAGGAGSLVQACPNATLLVHPRGLRHMVDPGKLEAGSRAVYGDEIYEALYGTLVPVPEARARAMQDGDTVGLGSRTLRFIDTPGHARHHFCVHDSLTYGWFTGDTFGLSYREFDTGNGAFMIPTTTPVQFDPVALQASIRRLMEVRPDYMYLTHYGRLDDVAPLAEKMLEGVAAFAAIGERFENDPDRTLKIEAAIRDWLLAGLRDHGVSMVDEEILQLLEADIRLNTAGIECWLDYRQRQGSE